MIDIVQISYFLKWIQNAIRYEVFGLSRTKVILDRSGDFCMLLLCWLDNLIKLVLYCLIYQTMGIKFDDRWRCNFWLTPIVKTKRKRLYKMWRNFCKKKLIQVIYVLHGMLVGKNLYKSEKCGQLKVLHLGMWKY